jgi:DNA modification methylase
MRTMPAGSVDAVVTDPPYGDINHVGRLHERAKYANGPIRKLHKEGADDVTFDWEELLTEVHRITRQWVYIFAGDKTGFARTWFNERDCMTRVGVWEKLNPTPLHGQLIWLSSVELIAIARKRGAEFFEFCSSPVWRHNAGTSELHPTQKPLSLMYRIVNASTRPGATVFDPFMGSGTTGVACVRTGRNFIGCEIDPTYYAIAQRRIAEAQLQPPLFPHEATAQHEQLTLDNLK